ncbi:MAG: nucleotidyltransferase domain-containing protein [Myxococcota bacterium]
MFPLFPHTHLLVVAGSRAHGLSGPDSDVDLRGFAVPPLHVYLSMCPGFEQADAPADMDVFRPLLRPAERVVVERTKLEGAVYGLQKLARLAADCNPHVLEVLFCRDAEVRCQTDVGRDLREGAHRFLSRRARHSFGGYATAQLKRIRNHRQWLLHPPSAAPTRAGFGLPETTLVPRDQLAAATAAIQKRVDSWELDFTGVPKSTVVDVQNRVAAVLAEQSLGADDRWASAARWVGLDDNFVDLMARERQYKRAMQEWQQHNAWKRNRNPERAALEERFGYDTKHGAHLVRLLTMAVEIVETGEVHVWRGDRDADELRAVRAGAWSYDTLEAFAESADARLDAALQSSPLPERPDLDALDAWVVELTRRTFATPPLPGARPA